MFRIHISDVLHLPYLRPIQVVTRRWAKLNGCLAIFPDTFIHLSRLPRPVLNVVGRRGLEWAG